MPIAQPTLDEVVNFGHYLKKEGLEYSDKPIKLRAGGESHLYFDAKRAISHGSALKKAGDLLLAKAAEQDLKFNVVAGMGIGGRALAYAMMMAANFKLRVTEANEDKSPGQRYGYGLHGTSIASDCDVLLVDDVATSGNSLLTLKDMIDADKGNVADAIVLVDRSAGEVAKRLGSIGLGFHAIYELDEVSQQIRPSA